MRRLILIATVAALVAVPAVSALAASPTETVKLGNYFYRPKTMTIHRGTKVKWVWETFGIEHNVAVKSGPVKFRSRNLGSGSYSFTFRKQGTYHIYCTLHPTLMKQTIVVK
jgi:plastocyanin